MAPAAKHRDPQLTAVGDCGHRVPWEATSKPLLENWLKHMNSSFLVLPKKQLR